MKFDILGVLPSRRGTCTKDNAPVPADYGHLVSTTIHCLLLALLIHRWRNEDRNRRVVVLDVTSKYQGFGRTSQKLDQA